ncbi:VPS10 domain-containing protein [Microscilla marina]|uniref:BNR/Asp-box repeat domain protein n=1 Tax=Microscilla marina ATCC 23134 TaxID=313606 RepID=A1ZCS9_MICM2|nr:FlgD immunoglobulin-like domain containing protein [Microscilla marina]EAY32081.1 BNR/Asp-box repeat domain protein [Microscilla marina ATCC 23134]
MQKNYTKPWKTTKFYLLTLWWVAGCMGFAGAQEFPSKNVMKAAVKRKVQMRQTSYLKEYPIRNIGPKIMGGRVVDIEGSRKNAKTYYVAYASGGVFKTTDNGNSFRPVFDHQARLTIGDIALAPSNENIVWVGTGENNSSRSSYSGYGVYKSVDAGKTWQNMGLPNTQHIGRIIVHPTNPNIVWVAALGALYSKNKDRGVYKTTDGGNTWKKTLYVNDESGIIDLAVQPGNPQVLVAASWEKARRAWSFKENGVGSGVYTSTDGGNTWAKTTKGLPKAEYIGRMGFDFCQSKPNVVYMVLDNQEELKRKKKAPKLSISFAQLRTMSAVDFDKLNNQELNKFLRAKRYPRRYKAANVKAAIKAGEYQPKALTTYFKNANDELLNATVRGIEVYRSNDAGKSWKKVNAQDMNRVFNTYGYYFGQIRVDPNNPETVYTFGVPCLKSTNGGKTWKQIAAKAHSDHQAMWINPKDSDHILLGNDGGVYSSYNGGKFFRHVNNVAAGQFYTVHVDMEKPYNVYGGLQDNGTYVGSSRPDEDARWKRLFGGDGMFVSVDPRNIKRVYVGFQYGNYYRKNQWSARGKRITPSHELGEKPLRFNWRTPLMMSKFNPDILYIGAQKVYKSIDQGKHWEAISGDLTKNKPNKNIPYSTITCIEQSPLSFNTLYVGTDDGNLQLTRNGGGSWQLISANLPANLWVSSVFPSPHEKATVFVALTGYRNDDFQAYMYKSTNYGKTWVKVSGDLPNEAVNRLIQDPVNPAVLYVGTDQGAYVSLNRGKNWHLIVNNFPNVATYDMLVHPRDNELVLATHGRSMFVMDVKPLQQLKGKTNAAVVAFAPQPVYYSRAWGKKYASYVEAYEPKVSLMYYIGKSTKNNVKIEVVDKNGAVVRKIKGKAAQGFYRYQWDLKTNKGAYVKRGKYTLKFSNGKTTAKVAFEVK